MTLLCVLSFISKDANECPNILTSYYPNSIRIVNLEFSSIRLF